MRNENAGIRRCFNVDDADIDSGPQKRHKRRQCTKHCSVAWCCTMNHDHVTSVSGFDELRRGEVSFVGVDDNLSKVFELRQ